MNRVTFLTVFFSFLLLPVAAFAQGGLLPCSGADCDVCDLVTLSSNVLEFMIEIAALIAALMFAYAGVLYLMSGPNPENLSKAHSIFWNVVIGLVLVAGAWLVINLIVLTLTGSGLETFTARCSLI